MPMGKSIRIYDLAREVKQDTKRVMEDVRREGADVSVASNTVSHEIAEKVRNKYFPKKETALKRGIKVIKKSAKPDEAPIVEPEIAEAEPVVEEVPEPPVTTPEVAPPVEIEAPAPSKVRKLAKKSEPEPEPAPAPAAEPEKTTTVKRLA